MSFTHLKTFRSNNEKAFWQYRAEKKKHFTIFPDNTIVLSSYFDTSTFEISHVRHSVTHHALPDTTLPTKVVLWGLGRLEPSNSKNLLAVPL